MLINKFEDIIAWRKSGELTYLIYKKFKDSKDFGYKNQIERATVSVMNNIAEGFERKTNNEFKQFLYIAKGFCGEVRSMLYLGLKLDYLKPIEFKKFYDLSLEISKCLSGLIKTL